MHISIRLSLCWCDVSSCVVSSFTCNRVKDDGIVEAVGGVKVCCRETWRKISVDCVVCDPCLPRWEVLWERRNTFSRRDPARVPMGVLTDGNPRAEVCASACWSLGPWVVLVAGPSMSWLLVMLAKVEDASVVGGSESR